MAQYRDYLQAIRISDDDIIIISTFAGGTQMSSTVANDGSMDTNFKAECAAHRDVVLSLRPSSTSPPSTVALRGKWVRFQESATVTSLAATVIVPTGNSGKLVFHIEDDGGGGLEYKVNTGSYATMTDGGDVTVADDDTLTLKATTLPAQTAASGTVTDFDTDVPLDSFSLQNSTAP